MKRLYYEVIALAERLTDGIISATIHLYKIAVAFVALVMFGTFLILIWATIIIVPSFIVYEFLKWVGVIS